MVLDKKDDGKGKSNKKNVKPIPQTPKAPEKQGKELKPKPPSGRLSPKSARKIPSNAQFQVDDDSYLGKLDLGDILLGEATLRQYETYTYNLDSILTFVKEKDGEKERDKSPLTSKLPNPNIPKKKNDKTISNESPANGTLLSSELDLHLHQDEGPIFVMSEISATSDEDSVFKLILEHLPKPAIQETIAEEKTLVLPPSVTELICHYPEERDQQVFARFFSLMPSVLVEDETDHTKKSVVRQVIKVDEVRSGDGEYDADKLLSGRFRWIINPGERREMIIKFVPTDVGKFDTVFAFELAGPQKRVVMPVSGVCQHSQIVSDPKKIFNKTRKSKDEKLVVSGEFITSTSCFEFGPLLYSKPRDKYQEKFPENHGTLNIINGSQTEIRVNICLRNDLKGDVFFFEPSTMDIAPGQSQVLHVWAYPRSHNQFDDSLIISIKDNPEPYIYKLNCIGVRPELELDKKTISFDKLLLGRIEKREIKLKNPTHMPIAWKVVGIEGLGDEFDIWPLEGIIDSFQEVFLNAEFCGVKPIIVKRMIRIEVSDTEKISGVVQELSVLVTAEAYDIAMDLHFPKGYEGGLDFGVVKVFEEGKQLCTLKNKGKYEVGFRFLFENADISDLFSTSPQQGILQPSDKPFFIQFLFKASKELSIRDNVSCKCQIFEPSTDEITATIPIKLCARAVFSKFSVMPARDLNFGSLVYGFKASRQFVIENTGEFDYKFSIYKLVANESKATQGKFRPISRGKFSKNLLS